MSSLLKTATFAKVSRSPQANVHKHTGTEIVSGMVAVIVAAVLVVMMDCGYNHPFTTAVTIIATVRIYSKIFGIYSEICLIYQTDLFPCII